MDYLLQEIDRIGQTIEFQEDTVFKADTTNAERNQTLKQWISKRYAVFWKSNLLYLELTNRNL